MATEKKQKSPGRSRWRRRLVIFVLLPLSAFLALLKWGIAPFIVRHGVVAGSRTRIRGRLDVRSAAVGFREVRLEGVSLQDATGRMLATVEAVVVRLDRPAFGFGRPGIESVLLIRPDASLSLEPDGSWDIQRALSPPPAAAEAPSSSPSPPSSAPAPVAVPSLPPFEPESVRIEDGTLRLRTPVGNPSFAGLNAKVVVEPRRFSLEQAEARTWNGRSALSGWVGRDPVAAWGLQANVTGADVHEMTRGTSLAGSALNGRLEAFLSLESSGTGGALGAGWIDVREGRLLELPVFLSVLNLLRLNAPGDSTIGTCRCDFQVRPDRLDIERCLLLTPGVCFFGNGSISLRDHAVSLDFVPRLHGEPPEGYETLAEAEAPVADFIKRNLLVSVEVRGTWMHPKAETVPLGAITKPLRDFFSKLGGKKR